MIANNVNIEHPGIIKKPACDLKDDSDLGMLPVTVKVPFLTEKEVKEYERLANKLATEVLAVPLKDGSIAVDFDGFFDVPSATVLEHVKPELIPETYLLNRGELTLKGRVVSPGLPRSLMDGSIPMNHLWRCLVPAIENN